MRALIIYASCEGQTEQIATRMAQLMTGHGVPTDTYNVSRRSADEIAIESYDALALGSPLHYGRHDSRIAWVIQEHLPLLSNIPSAFFSVSLGLVSEHAKDRDQAQWLAGDFLRSLGWEPLIKQCFAGALKYSRYGWLKKKVMQRIARESGAVTDPHHDYEYTDWQKVDRFAQRFAELIQRSSQPREIQAGFSWTRTGRHDLSTRGRGVLR